MKRPLLSLLDRVRADLNDIGAAIERGDLDTAIQKLHQVADQLISHANAMRS